jgi:hypothetical protein
LPPKIVYKLQQALSVLFEFLGQENFQCHTQGTQIGHQVKQIVENLPQNYTQVIFASMDKKIGCGKIISIRK